MKNHFIASETLAETGYASDIATPAPLKRLMGGLTALAVVVSMLVASVVPSRAGSSSDDLAKALAAALILGIILNEAGNDRPKTTQPPVRRALVPGVCAIEFGGYDGARKAVVYPERCLRQHGFAYQLPDCARPMRIYGQQDRVYPEHCLREAGFDIGRTAR